MFTNDSPGQRLIVAHAGGEDGFIPGAFLMYNAKSKRGDYHNEMNAENVTTRNQVIPGLPPQVLTTHPTTANSLINHHSNRHLDMKS